MSLRDALFLVAAVGQLALALATLSRAGKSPLALPVALLALDFFGWTFATFMNHRYGGPAWRSIDVFFTTLGPAPALHVVLGFVGATRARASLLRATWGLFGAFALVGAASLHAPWGSGVVESPAWAAAFLAAWLPTLVLELWLLVRHLRTSADPTEKARTRVVLSALFLGAAFAATDPVQDVGVAIPSLTPLGALATAALLAIVAMRLRLFDRNLGGTTSLYAGSVALSAVLVYLVLFQGLRGHLPALAFGVTVATIALGAVVREAAGSLAAHRERVDRLAVLGRFSAQMAHDLKNPLAALVGAVQVMDGDPEDPFRKMIVEQADRIRAIVEKYDRLGRVEPVRTIVRINDVVRRVTTLSRYGTTHDVDVRLSLGDVPECDLDPDLVSGALENLVRNALEACAAGGTITVTTRVDSRSDGARDLVVTVEDSGMGMDARHVERAFDDFFTTKTTGSGLGLPFVRRVALAHGGDATLVSKVGKGTIVEVRFLA